MNLPQGKPMKSLPLVLVGPSLRRVTPTQLVIWLVTTQVVSWRFKCIHPGEDRVLIDLPLDETRCRTLAVGDHAFLQLIDLQLDEPLPTDLRLEYDLLYLISPELRTTDQDLADPGSGWIGIAEWGSELLYPGETRPGFVLKPRLDTMLHGSCRKPHYPTGDGLARVDGWLAARLDEPARWPTLLMLSGDQIYADDVAGPMLAAIMALGQRLALPSERFEGACVQSSEELQRHQGCFYHREQLLPRIKANKTLRELFFGGARKPIFTSDSAHNHLITFAEVMACYFLSWSPEPWRCIEPAMPPLAPKDAARYREQQQAIDRFVEQLPAARRLMAHLSTYMIFDDHDITDDWNLTAGWEQVAYGHPFSRRIIGNALLGYLLCQGWGNRPDAFDGELLDTVADWLEHPDSNLDSNGQDALISRLLAFQGWHYTVPTSPHLLVLDTRTRRWRSERSPGQPSGLMDWEALSELQQAMLDQQAMVIVSPAPVFGVKLIEAVQKLFTFLGHPLLVDAENWMAHPGSANVILNIFRHSRTPQHFVILSGDVHYSFVYAIEIRFRQAGPKIWQITSSGIKNEFPPALLRWFDRLNRWLYSPRSPLNWFTRRRLMRVRPHKPENGTPGERLVNKAGIGYLRLDTDGRPLQVIQLGADGEDVRFLLDGDEEEHWG